MSDNNQPHNSDDEERIKNPKKVNDQTKQIADSSDDEDSKPELARDRQPKPKKSEK